MNGYTCIKSLTLGGVGYTAGSNIPGGAVLPGRIRALIKQGYISPITDESAPAVPLKPHSDPEPLYIPILKDGGELQIPSFPESVIEAIRIIQLTAEECIRGVETMSDETALILIHALDSRKTVKAAAQARAEILNGCNDPAGNETNRSDA